MTINEGLMVFLSILGAVAIVILVIRIFDLMG